MKGKEKFSKKSGKIRELLKCLIASVKSGDFLYIRSYIQLSVIVARFTLFAYHSVLCCDYEAQFHFVMKP